MSGPIFDSQFDDVHRVLVNKLGITDPSALENHIARLSFLRVMELEERPLRGNFDIKHLRAIHRHIFQDVFPWAGEFREVRTSRSDSFGFPPPQFLVPSLEELFAKLRRERHLVELHAGEFADRAAYFLGELNAVHPFREGNGRAQREFIRCVARNAGHRLSWARITQSENDAASQVSFAKGDHSLLAAMIRRGL